MKAFFLFEIFSGLWNVPYMYGVYLVQKRHLPVVSQFRLDTGYDNDMVLCSTFRDKVGFFKYLPAAFNFSCVCYEFTDNEF